MAEIATISKLEQELVSQMATVALEFLEIGNIRGAEVTLESILRILDV